VFEGEAGVDAGGLTKEFFHLAFEAVVSRTYKDCQLFEVFFVTLLWTFVTQAGS